MRVIHWLIDYLPPQYRARALNYLVLMRLDRPVGALLLLWPTWWALWFAANDFPPIGTLIIFTLGVFVMRSAGCVINDYADHEWLDAHVERTRGRPMAAGRVTRREALLLFAALLALAFVLVLFTNTLTIELSFVGAAFAAVYPFSKRVTHLAQVVLGAAFGWSIPMAFAAVTNTLPPLCWLLFLANVLFSTIYDTEYAMVDREDDIRVGAQIHRDPVRRIRPHDHRRADGDVPLRDAAGRLARGAALAVLPRTWHRGGAISPGSNGRSAIDRARTASPRSATTTGSGSRSGSDSCSRWRSASSTLRSFMRAAAARAPGPTTSTRATPARRNTRAHSRKVAPVVITSSTSATCRQLARVARRQTRLRRLRRRAAASRPVCADVARTRTSKSRASGTRTLRESAFASSSAWL